MKLHPFTIMQITEQEMKDIDDYEFVLKKAGVTNNNELLKNILGMNLSSGKTFYHGDIFYDKNDNHYYVFMIISNNNKDFKGFGFKKIKRFIRDSITYFLFDEKEVDTNLFNSNKILFKQINDMNMESLDRLTNICFVKNYLDIIKSYHAEKVNRLIDTININLDDLEKLKKYIKYSCSIFILDENYERFLLKVNGRFNGSSYIRKITSLLDNFKVMLVVDDLDSFSVLNNKSLENTEYMKKAQYPLFFIIGEIYSLKKDLLPHEIKYLNRVIQKKLNNEGNITQSNLKNWKVEYFKSFLTTYTVEDGLVVYAENTFHYKKNDIENMLIPIKTDCYNVIEFNNEQDKVKQLLKYI